MNATIDIHCIRRSSPCMLILTADCDRFIVSLQVADFPSLVLDGTLVHPPSDHGSPSAMLNNCDPTSRIWSFSIYCTPWKINSGEPFEA
jgi:hypothetical protein